jgi:hypothetical protein
MRICRANKNQGFPETSPSRHFQLRWQKIQERELETLLWAIDLLALVYFCRWALKKDENNKNDAE